jgi:hypothetical protein
MDLSIALFLNDVIVLVIVTVGGLLLRSLLPAYFEQKGKDIATKEDIEEITAKTERVRAQFTSEIELLRSELSKRSHSYALVFDKEFELLQQLWEALWEYHESVICLLSLVKEGGDEREEQIITNMSDKYGIFIGLVMKKRPFYAPDIYAGISAIIDLSDELTDHRLESPIDRTRLDQFEKEKLDALAEALDGLCESIRKQIFENPEPVIA